MQTVSNIFIILHMLVSRLMMKLYILLFPGNLVDNFFFIEISALYLMLDKRLLSISVS